MQIKDILTTDLEGVMINNKFIPLERSNDEEIDIYASADQLSKWYKCDMKEINHYCHHAKSYVKKLDIQP